MKMIQSFDPSSSASGSFKHQVANPCGGAYLFNESNQWIQLTLPDGGNVGLPAWWARFYHLADVQGPVLWQVLDTIATVASPLSKVYGESYERNEIVGRNFYDGPIPRNPYIANSVSSTVSTNSVENTGNPPGTNVLSATQSGSSGLNASILNDGNFFFAQWVASVYEKYFQGVPGANPLVQLGAKAFLQMADNAGVFGTILRIDPSGNTVFQQHPTGADFVFQDHAGATIYEIDSGGHPIVNNNTSFRARDNGGTQQPILRYSATNDVEVLAGTSGNLNLEDNAGNVLAQLTANGLNITGQIQQVSGDTSGQMTVQEIFSGGMKIVCIKHNNYRQNAATPQQIVLKNTFTGPFFIVAMGNATLQLLNGASVQSGNYLNAISPTSSGFTAESSIGQCVVGWNNTAIDRIQCPGSIASAHTGICVFIGF